MPNNVSFRPFIKDEFNASKWVSRYESAKDFTAAIVSSSPSFTTAQVLVVCIINLCTNAFFNKQNIL